MAHARRCGTPTAAGTKCKMPRLKGGTKCFTHSKSSAAQRAAACKKGGRRRKKKHSPVPVPVGSIGELQTHLARVMADTLVLDNTLHRSRTLRGLIAEGRQLIDVGEFERRLEEIEAWRDSGR